MSRISKVHRYPVDETPAASMFAVSVACEGLNEPPYQADRSGAVHDLGKT